MASQRKRDTIVEYEPVAYDKSITFHGHYFRATVRRDDKLTTFSRHSFEAAKALLDCLPPDVYEGPNRPPASVFYPTWGNDA